VTLDRHHWRTVVRTVVNQLQPVMAVRIILNIPGLVHRPLF
jgi:hypothetical protein